MGDMGDIFNTNKEMIKKQRQQRKENFEPLLKEIGAEHKSDGVWMLDGWLLYPTKGYAMYSKNYNRTKSLKQFIEDIRRLKNV